MSFQRKMMKWMGSVRGKRVYTAHHCEAKKLIPVELEVSNESE